jgi:hypothetical protein
MYYVGKRTLRFSYADPVSRVWLGYMRRKFRMAIQPVVTTEDRTRVRATLYIACDKPDAVNALQNSWQLHLFASYWNWDNGTLDPLRRVIRDPRCDRGTALIVYWEADPVSLYEQAATKDDLEPTYVDERELFEFLVEIEERVADGFYTHHIIGIPLFDPDDPEEDPRLRKNVPLKKQIPSVMLSGSPGIAPREQRTYGIYL